MRKTTGRILKADNIKIEGQFQLALDQSAMGPPSGQASTSTDTPSACIVENHPEFAIVEITCSCGTKTRLKCEYAGADASAGQESEQAE